MTHHMSGSWLYMQNTASHTAIAGRVALSKRNKVED